MDADSLVKIIGWALPLLSFIGLGAVYLRGSADKGTIESLQRSNAALKEELEIEKTKNQNRADDAARKITGLVEDNDRLKQQVVSLGRQLHTLQGVVTQAPQIARLQETLEGHHDETSELLREIVVAIGGPD